MILNKLGHKIDKGKKKDDRNHDDGCIDKADENCDHKGKSSKVKHSA